MLPAVLVESELATGLPTEPPASIMFMPAGKHSLRPQINGVPQDLALDVTADLASRLQAQLELRATANVRPFADFDHKPGPAAFLPKRFFWKDGEGILLEVDWTQAGRKAIEGRDYSYFSPTFTLDASSQAHLPERGAIGALTNSPAFTQIRRISASHSSAMTSPLLAQCVTLGLCEATATEETAGPLVQAAHQALIARVEAAQAEAGALRIELEERRKVDAEALVEAAVAQGRIPPKNTALKTFLVSLAVSDPENAKVVLASYAPSPVLTPVVTGAQSVAASPAGSSAPVDLAAKVESGILLLQATHHIGYDEARQLLRVQQPSLFAHEEDVEHDA